MSSISSRRAPSFAFSRSCVNWDSKPDPVRPASSTRSRHGSPSTSGSSFISGTRRPLASPPSNAALLAPAPRMTTCGRASSSGDVTRSSRVKNGFMPPVSSGTTKHHCTCPCVSRSPPTAHGAQTEPRLRPCQTGEARRCLVRKRFHAAERSAPRGSPHGARFRRGRDRLRHQRGSCSPRVRLDRDRGRSARSCVRPLCRNSRSKDRVHRPGRKVALGTLREEQRLSFEVRPGRDGRTSAEELSLAD